MSLNAKFDLIKFLVRRSLSLDLKLLFQTKGINLLDKANFILKKYIKLVQHFYSTYATGISCTNIFDGPLYYNSRLGTIAGYQSILCEHMMWLKKYVQTDDQIFAIDVGANVGYFTRALMYYFRKIQILSIEPSQITMKAFIKNLPNTRIYDLEKKLTMNKQDTVTLLKCGVSSKNELKYLVETENNTSLNMLKSQFGLNLNEVSCFTLDTILENLSLEQRKIDILKIDTEGFELEVLKGMRKTLRNVSYILIELNSQFWTMSQFENFLNSIDLKFEVLESRNFDLGRNQEFKNGDILIKIL
jgi:FkbM family methyltransferase